MPTEDLKKVHQKKSKQQKLSSALLANINRRKKVQKRDKESKENVF